MADVKISDLVSANVLNKNDLFLLVQDDSSKNVSAGTIFSSITDPTLSGNIFISGPVQSLSGVGTVSVTTTRTDLYGGVSAAAAAIANGSVLPSTIYLYTEGKSVSGRGLQFQSGASFFKTIYVQHKNGKIHLSLGANATSTLNHAPDQWVGTTGLRPFNEGLHFVKGAVYTFDVSHPTNAGNIIGLSTSIDGTNTLGLEYVAGVVRTGNPGNTGATIEFTPANVSIDQGGKNYLDIPKGVDGQLKVINLVATNGGQFVISSNIQNNLAIELRRAGDSAFLMYSGNAWILVGSNPGLQTSFSGTSDDIPEGQKLYFTNARARAAISVPDNTLIYNATTGSIRANVLALSNINLGNIIPNSDSIPEGAVNLYYSNARVHANLKLASIDALADVDTVTIVPQTGYALVWNGTKWIPNVISASTFSGSVAFSNVANVANIVLSLSNFTTANLTEGINLYYTNARVHANLALASINTLADVNVSNPAVGQVLYWNGTSWESNSINIPSSEYANIANTVVNIVTGSLSANISNFANTASFALTSNVANTASFALTSNVANTVLSLNNFTTANLAEGTNLYYTNARVNVQIALNLALKANIVDLTTANVVELNNLYYTNTRVNAQVASNLALKANVADLTTANVVESFATLTNRTYGVTAPGSSAYVFTGYGSGNNIAITVEAGTVLTFTVNASGHPFWIKTAAVTGTGSAVTTGVTNNGVAIGTVIWDTAGIAPGTYYYICQYHGGMVGTITVVERPQYLYYTNARVFSNLSLASINVLADVDTLTTPPSAGQALSWNGTAWIPTTVSASNANTSNQANVANTVLSIGNFTTSNLAEGTNLYYTNARVYANVIGLLNAKANVVDLTTANVIELNNLYYTNARVNAQVEPNLRLKANVVDLTTANIVELNNLYYTNARVNAQVEPNLRLKANVVDLTTANVSESASNLYYTNARVYANVTARLGAVNLDLVPDGDEIYDLGSPTNKWRDLYLSGFSLSLGNTRITSGAGGALSVQALASNSSVTTKSITSNVWNNLYTANVIETNGNLYYTNARVRSTLSNGTGVYYDTVTGVISIGQNVDTTSNVTFNNMTLTGNLNVVGNVVGFYANTLIITDPLIQLGYGNPSDSIDLGLLGHYNDGTQKLAGVFRDATDKKFKFFDNFPGDPGAATVDTTNASFRLANVVATTYEGNVVGNVTGFVSTISNFTTANLAEGTQLYYTNTRVESYVNPKLTTANVVELDNLYYTNARVESYVNPKLTTANVVELNNLYYTNARVNAQVESNLRLKANVIDLTTANVAELNNLYYTNARVLSNVAQMSINVFADVDISGIGNNGILIWNGTSFVAGSPTSATEANFANVAGTANVALVATFANTSGTANFANTAGTANVANTVLSLNNFTTANLAEGTNLYYTNARVNAQVESNLILKANVTDLTTANVIESLSTLTNRTYGVTAPGSSAYVFTGYGSGNNIAITVEAGTVLTFTISASGHPFWIKTAAVTGTGSAVTTGVTNNGTQNGTLIWNTAGITPGTYYYICQYHGGMVGTITVVERPHYIYYTNARVNAQVAPNLALKANVVDLTTANVIELNNLYYSNARVLSNVAQMSINVFADVDITNIQPNDTLVWDGTKFIKANAGQSTAIVANITTTGNVEITRFSTATYSTAKYVYTVKGISGGYTNKYNSGELLIMHDDTSSFITQYAMISNDQNLDLLSFVVDINNGNVIIYGNVSDPAIQVTVKLTGATYTAK